jgi:ribulose-phosphate 3-epimerase
MAKVVPGILTADEDDYHRRLKLAEYVADLVQIDIVDGKFSPNSTVGSGIIKKYPPACSLEIQLMAIYPLNYIDELAPLPFVSRIIFPFEIEGDVSENIYLIKRLGKQAGLSLNPDTPVAAALHYFDDIDLLLLMTGNPGYSGQKLGEETYDRIKTAKRLNSALPLEIDIGVNFENAGKLAGAGADFLVSSSALFNEPDFRVAYEKMAKIASVR